MSSDPSAPSAGVTFAEVGGLGVLVLTGEFDAFTTQRLNSAIDALPEHLTSVHIDGQAVTFASSALVGALLGLQRRLGDDGSVRVIAASAVLCRILEITGLAGQLGLDRNAD